MFIILGFLSVLAIILSICIFIYWINIVLGNWYYNLSTLKRWILRAFILLIGGILGICYSLAKGGFF